MHSYTNAETQIMLRWFPILGVWAWCLCISNMHITVLSLSQRSLLIESLFLRQRTGLWFSPGCLLTEDQNTNSWVICPYWFKVFDIQDTIDAHECLHSHITTSDSVCYSQPGRQVQSSFSSVSHWPTLELLCSAAPCHSVALTAREHTHTFIQCWRERERREGKAMEVQKNTQHCRLGGSIQPAYLSRSTHAHTQHKCQLQQTLTAETNTHWSVSGNVYFTQGNKKRHNTKDKVKWLRGY